MVSPVPITIVIPTRDEAAQIAECVRQLAWAGEVMVVDGGSTDDTAALARAVGASVIECDGRTIAGQRNLGIAAASHEWVFALDADERIGPELAAELARVVAPPAPPGMAHQAYAVRRRNVYLGKPITRAGWGRDWVVRLFRRDRRYVERRVHEGLEPVADVGRLADQGRRARIADLLIRPPARFVRMYLLQLGLLEGWRGALLSGFGAMTVFLKYARLWERAR